MSAKLWLEHRRQSARTLIIISLIIVVGVLIVTALMLREAGTASKQSFIDCEQPAATVLADGVMIGTGQGWTHLDDGRHAIVCRYRDGRESSMTVTVNGSEQLSLSAQAPHMTEGARQFEIPTQHTLPDSLPEPVSSSLADRRKPSPSDPESQQTAAHGTNERPNPPPTIAMTTERKSLRTADEEMTTVGCYPHLPDLGGQNYVVSALPVGWMPFRLDALSVCLDNGAITCTGMPPYARSMLSEQKAGLRFIGLRMTSGMANEFRLLCRVESYGLSVILVAPGAGSPIEMIRIEDLDARISTGSG